MLNKSLEQLLSASLAIEDKSAIERDDLGFTARCLVLATLPHSKPVEQQYTRKSGNFTMTILAEKEIGLPYGSIPRLLLCWLTTEAVRTKSKTLTLGESLPDFMRKLGIGYATSGKTGSRTRIREQCNRLFSARISCRYKDTDRDSLIKMDIVNSYDLWWTAKEDEQGNLWQSTITLSENFYSEITKSSIPLDLLALKALKKSPLAIDIYLWLTYRMSYLKESCPIPWHSLQKQFGSEYDRLIDFKVAFKDAVKKVKVVYAGANITINDDGVLLKAGSPSIPKKQLKKVLVA